MKKKKSTKKGAKKNIFKTKLLSKKNANVLTLLSLSLIIIGAILVLVSLIRISNPNTAKIGQIAMSYAKNNSIITLTNTLPMKDEKGKHSKNYFDFAITSKANDKDGASIPYSLVLNPKTINKEKKLLNPNQVKVYLTQIQNGEEMELLAPTLISELEKVNNQYNLYNTENIHKDSDDAITTEYRLRAWIDNNAGTKNNYQYKFEVNVKAGAD